MSRPLRIQYPDAWYHLMNRGRRREEIYIDKGDYIAFIELLHEASEVFNVCIAAYCLMSNHYHLLIQTPDGNLSRCMRHINGVYTQRFNRRHGHDGPLFRGRYRSILIDQDSYLLVCEKGSSLLLTLSTALCMNPQWLNIKIEWQKLIRERMKNNNHFKIL